MKTYLLYVYTVDPRTLAGEPADIDTEVLKAESNDLAFIGALYDHYKKMGGYKVMWYRVSTEQHKMGSVSP